jgi:hypothetical protein
MRTTEPSLFFRLWSLLELLRLLRTAMLERAPSGSWMTVSERAAFVKGWAARRDGSLR